MGAIKIRNSALLLYRPHWERTSANHTSDKRYVSRIYKFNKKEKYNLSKKKRKGLGTLLPENTQKCQTHQKNTQYHFAFIKTNTVKKIGHSICWQQVEKWKLPYAGSGNSHFGKQ